MPVPLGKKANPATRFPRGEPRRTTPSQDPCRATDPFIPKTICFKRIRREPKRSAGPHDAPCRSRHTARQDPITHAQIHPARASSTPPIQPVSQTTQRHRRPPQDRMHSLFTMSNNPPFPSQPESQEPKEKRNRFHHGHATTPRWWSLTGSNRRHPACKAGALPAELRPLRLCAPAREFPRNLARLRANVSASPTRGGIATREPNTNGGPGKT